METMALWRNLVTLKDCLAGLQDRSQGPEKASD